MRLSGLGALLTSILCSVPFTSACAQETHELATLNTETYVRIVAGLAEAYRSQVGRYPVALSELCTHGLRNCGGIRPLDGDNDGWGRPFVYTPIGAGFELRSLGADGTVDTPDDYIVNSDADRVRARELAGCYTASRSLWEGRSSSVRLDTTAGTLGPTNGTYRLLIDAPRNFGAEWYPVGRDSVALQWNEFPAVPSIRARVAGDTLRARATSAGEERQSLELVRVACDN